MKTDKNPAQIVAEIFKEVGYEDYQYHPATTWCYIVYVSSANRMHKIGRAKIVDDQLKIAKRKLASDGNRVLYLLFTSINLNDPDMKVHLQNAVLDLRHMARIMI